MKRYKRARSRPHRITYHKRSSPSPSGFNFFGTTGLLLILGCAIVFAGIMYSIHLYSASEDRKSRDRWYGEMSKEMQKSAVPVNQDERIEKMNNPNIPESTRFTIAMRLLDQGCLEGLDLILGKLKESGNGQFGHPRIVTLRVDNGTRDIVTLYLFKKRYCTLQRGFQKIPFISGNVQFTTRRSDGTVIDVLSTSISRDSDNMILYNVGSINDYYIRAQLYSELGIGTGGGKEIVREFSGQNLIIYNTDYDIGDTLPEKITIQVPAHMDSGFRNRKLRKTILVRKTP